MSLEKSKNPRDVIIAPVVSEKSYACMDRGQYTFIVAPGSNKTEIKQAVEAIFDVKVSSVNTINRKGKTHRTRTGDRQVQGHPPCDRHPARGDHRHLR